MSDVTATPTTPAETPPPAAETPAYKPAEAKPEAKPEKTLAERRASLAEIAKGEKSKLQERRAENRRSNELQQQLVTERAEKERLAAEARAALERAMALEDELKDPLGLLHKRGVTAKDIAERALKQNTPEAAQDELRAELERLKQEHEKNKREYESRVQEAERARQYEAARKRLHDTFGATKTEFPILAKICQTPERLEREYMAAWQTIQADPEARKHTYTDQEIFSAMEASRRADLDDAMDVLDVETLEKHLTRRKPNAKTNAEATPAGAPQGTESAKATKTLTNDTGNGGGEKKWFPDDFHKLPEKEQNRLLAAAIAGGWRG